MKAYPFILLVPFSFLLSFTSSYASDMRAQKTEQAGYVCDFRNYNFIENKNVLLNIDRSENPQQLFFIQNRVPDKITIDYVSTGATGASASAGWSSQLDENHWSAMAINEKNMRFKCTRTEDGKTIPVLCKYVLKVCRALSPSFGKGTVGNYWVAENQASLSELIKQAQDRGISLQAPAAAAPQPTAYPQQAPPQKTETPAPAGIVE